MTKSLSLFQWICSRCAVVRSIPVEEVLGIRVRFGHEKCPLCTNPGTGMEYVKVSPSHAIQGVQ